jgi:uncharacterized membrane protein (UPF0127 family)
MRPVLRGTSILIGVLLGSVLLSYTTSRNATVLPTSAIFGDSSLTLEYATSSEARALGLGNRTSVPDGHGMLFAFPRDDYYGFWMKDTLVPLDMFWLDAQGHVVFIVSDVSPDTYPHVFYPSVPARYVLETAAGFAEAHGIGEGTLLLLKKFPVVSK